MTNLIADGDLLEVLSVRILTDSAYILRFSKGGMVFRPGQHLVLGLPGTGEFREYSIYSGIHDDFLEILVREVEEGMVSRQMKMLKQGEKLIVRGPYGIFMADRKEYDPENLYLIASGTGIAPFHSLIRSFDTVNYTLIHGVRRSEEAFERDHYRSGNYILCTSRDADGDYPGRLTGYLNTCELRADSRFYLCGNRHMIYDVMEILRAKGIAPGRIHTEVYF